MIIAIDFDETYTRDPDMWNRIIETMQDRGHTVYCITMRRPSEMTDVYGSIGRFVGLDFCIPTSRQGKRAYVYAHHNLIVDVWIDDNPLWVETDAGTPLTVNAERANG